MQLRKFDTQIYVCFTFRADQSPASTKTAMTLPASNGGECSSPADVTSPVNDVILLDLSDVIDTSYAMLVYANPKSQCHID